MFITYLSLKSALFVFSFIASAFWSFQVIFAFLTHRRETNADEFSVHIPKLSVIVPIYNEPPTRYAQTIQSLINQKKCELEIIIADDGSDIPVQVNNANIQVLRLEHRGKRDAQFAAIKAAKNDWIATLDGDTTLDDYALFNLYREIQRLGLDAITGTVYLSNERQNLLTRVTASMYWYSFFQERASQSYFGLVTCCSGALSLYRKQTILENEENYLNQRFCGQICRTGDDRQLTNIFILNGKRVGWTSKAKAFTFSPPTLVGFAHQQIRWTRSNVSSLQFLLTRIRKWPFLFGFLIGRLYFRYIYQLFIYCIAITLTITTQSIVPFLIIIASILIIAGIKSIIAYIYTRKTKFFLLLVYTLLAFFIFSPLMLYSIITPTKGDWHK